MRRRSAIVAVVATGLALLSASYAARSWLAPAAPSLVAPSASPRAPTASASDGALLQPTVEPMVEPGARPRSAPPRGPASPRFGRVIDAQNGVPLSGAKIGRPAPAPGGLLDRAIFSLQRFEPAATSDDAGRFEVALADGEWLVVAADGYAAHPIAAAKLGATRELAGAVQLDRPARLRATVTFEEGAPAAGVDVRVLDSIDGARFVVEARTDARGEALVGGIAPGRELQIELADGFALLWRDPVTTLFTAGAGIVKPWKLEGPTIVGGRVLDQHGEPVVGAKISAHVEKQETFDPSEGAAQARALEERWGVNRWGGGARATDGDGRFLVGPMKSGVAVVAVGPREQEERERCHCGTMLFTTLRDGERSRWLELAVDRGLVIRGRLVAADGEARACDVATLMPGERGALERVAAITSDEEGRFELRGVSRRCEALLLATSCDGAFATRTPVVVRTGPDEQRLALASAHSVVVAPRTASDEPAKATRVLFFRASDGSLATPCIVAERDELWFVQEFRVAGLAPGSYDVYVQGNGEFALVRGFVVEPAGAQRLEPRFERAGTIVIRAAVPPTGSETGTPRPMTLRVRAAGLLLAEYSSLSGDPLEALEPEWVEASVKTVRLGHRYFFSSLPLPPGRVLVEQEIGGRRSSKTLEIRAGERHDLGWPFDEEVDDAIEKLRALDAARNRAADDDGS